MKLATQLCHDIPEVSLQAMVASDMPFLMHSINCPDVGKWLPFYQPFDVLQAQQFLAKVEDKQSDYCAWMIVPKALSKPVGCLVLHSQFHPYCLQIGYWLHPSFWRRGYGLAAVQLMCESAFEKLEAVRVQAQVHTDNAASIALLEKAGFVRESTMPLGAAKANDTPADAYLYVRLKDNKRL